MMTYLLGEIEQHKVFMTYLPTGCMGNTSAASVAKNMRRTFTWEWFTLPVGIAGCAPNIAKRKYVGLGDILVSVSKEEYGGVVSDLLSNFAWVNICD